MAVPSRKRWWMVALRVVIGLAALYVMLRWFEHCQVYHPSARLEPVDPAMAPSLEDVWFEAADGVRLNGWFFPSTPGAPVSDRAVLLCHGNAGNISHRLDHVAALRETGVSVFVFDYRGYGRSRGRPGEDGTYLDAQAACRWLVGRGFAGTNIVALGESLGGGVAAELAVRERVGGLALLSAFTSVPDLGAELFPWLPVRRLATIRYDTRAKLPGVHVPVLIMHSRRDELVGFHHAERNHAAANEPKLLWEVSGDHNGFLDADPARYVEGWRRFLALLDGRGRPAPATAPR